jgi:lactate permease
MFNLPFLLAVSPFILFLLLLLWKKMPLLKVSFVTLLVVAGLVFFYWRIFPPLLWASNFKGLLVALDIFVIVFGAIFFLEIIRKLKIIDSICYYLESFSQDYRVQIIILAWFFENFLEGTAGFGTPVVVVAPLLIGLGLKPLKAIVIALLGNSASVVFGAAGTPIRVGFEGLDVTGVPLTTALINLVGLIVPVFMLWIMTADKEDGKQQFKEALPFAIWSGVVFSVVSIPLVFLGQEFPSILGSVIGLFVIMVSLRLNIFAPKNIRSGMKTVKPSEVLPLSQAALPYALLIVFLIAGKFLISGMTASIQFQGLGHSFNLFNPGLAFIISGLIVTLIWRNEIIMFITKSVTLAFKRAIEPFLVIVFMSAITQMMINAGQNETGLSSPIALIAQAFETPLLPLWSPFIGAFGAFITGSATISNIMFGNFLNLAAQAMHMVSGKILALLLVGGAAGNMIALADMLSGEAVLGLRNEERRIIKEIIIPCLIYLLLTGLIGILII